MTSVSAASARRGRGRIWLAIGFVLLVQVVLIFWLSDRSSAIPVTPKIAPVLHMSRTAPGELFPLEDPTLFALPHRQSFSGRAWMNVPEPELHVESPPEPPRFLTVNDEQLGADFARFAATNLPPSFQTAVLTEPAMASPPLPAVKPMLSASTLQVDGAIARRRLWTASDLPSWPTATLLTNTVVQVLVDGAGNVVSAFLSTHSGSEEADKHALQVARAARFEATEPIGPQRPKNLPPDLTVGRFIFQWQTRPPTNAAPAAMTQ